MTKKKVVVEGGQPVVDEAPAAAVESPVATDEQESAEVVPVTIATAPPKSLVVTAATITKPSLNNDDLASVVADAVRQAGRVTIVVTNEADYSAVWKLLQGTKKSVGVKIKPSQGVRALWRANNG